MLKKLSIIAASIVAFAFIFVSITHACSGLTSMNPAMQQSPMNMGTSDGFPCGKEKPDICKSVRDSILSIQPSVSKPDISQQPVLPIQLSIESEDPTQVGFAPLFPVIERAFHPVFKLSLTLSYLVLRI